MLFGSVVRVSLIKVLFWRFGFFYFLFGCRNGNGISSERIVFVEIEVGEMGG